MTRRPKPRRGIPYRVAPQRVARPLFTQTFPDMLAAVAGIAAGVARCGAKPHLLAAIVNATDPAFVRATLATRHFFRGLRPDPSVLETLEIEDEPDDLRLIIIDESDVGDTCLLSEVSERYSLEVHCGR